MSVSLSPDAFLASIDAEALFDVRTPSEYATGHLPGATNLPLFDDDERAVVGTTYKQVSRDEAILKGLEFVGPKMRDMVEQVRAVQADGRVFVYCWRGGMRSYSVGWLLELMGYDVVTLRGGYKAYRTFALAQPAAALPFYVVGGLTGAGKTEVLHALRARGEQIVDLEGIAQHKGSVFGGHDEPAQPTQQQFENELALHLHRLDPSRPVWIEDESRRIGDRSIPETLWEAMQAAPLLVLEVPTDVRVQRLVDLYGSADMEELRLNFLMIQRRLGGQRTQEALAALEAGDLETACRISLHYYDRAYRHSLERRPQQQQRTLCPADATPDALAAALLAATSPLPSR